MPLKNTLSDIPFIHHPAELPSLVEIYDAFDRPLMLTSLPVARKLKLSRRIVQICLRDTRHRVYVQQQGANGGQQTGLWDISVNGNVQAGEALYDAARRELHQALGLEGVRLRLVSSLPYEDSQGVKLLASFFLAGPSTALSRPDVNRSTDGMFLDEDELRGLIRHQAEMFTPELIWAVRSGWIFP